MLEREYRNKSPISLPRRSDSSTATPGGDVTSALEKLLVAEQHEEHKKKKESKKKEDAKKKMVEQKKPRLKTDQHHLHSPDEVTLLLLHCYCCTRYTACSVLQYTALLTVLYYTTLHCLSFI
jgi:hypothetical protein